MRVLLDHDLSSRRIARSLEQRGHNVRPLAAEAAFDAADDADVLALAAQDRRILVTRNSRDFEPLTREWAEAGRSHAGVILVWSLRSNQFAGIVSAVERSFALYPRAAQWRNLVVSV